MREVTGEQCLTPGAAEPIFHPMPKPRLPPKVCAYVHCPRRGRPFIPKKPHQRFCRDSCRWSDWQEKHPRQALGGVV